MRKCAKKKRVAGSVQLDGSLAGLKTCRGKRNCAHRKTKWANEKKLLEECVRCGARRFIGERRWVPKYTVGASGGK